MFPTDLEWDQQLLDESNINIEERSHRLQARLDQKLKQNAEIIKMDVPVQPAKIEMPTKQPMGITISPMLLMFILLVAVCLLLININSTCNELNNNIKLLLTKNFQR